MNISMEEAKELAQEVNVATRHLNETIERATQKGLTVELESSELYSFNGDLKLIVTARCGIRL